MSHRRLARKAWRRLRSAPPALLVALGVAVCVFFRLAANALVQVARKPTELFSPVSGALDKTPAETWHSHEPMFRNRATASITPGFLAAIMHLCGVAAGEAFARRGFGLSSNQRCGNQNVGSCLGQVYAMQRACATLVR